MFAKLSALVSSGPTFPYTLGEAYETAWGSWTHYRGKAREDGAAVSVFKISAGSRSDPKLLSARNGVKRLKTVRDCAQWVPASLRFSSSVMCLARSALASSTPSCSLHFTCSGGVSRVRRACVALVVACVAFVKRWLAQLSGRQRQPKPLKQRAYTTAL